MTPLQLEASAHAPWTRTMFRSVVGRAASRAVRGAGAVDRLCARMGIVGAKNATHAVAVPHKMDRLVVLFANIGSPDSKGVFSAGSMGVSVLATRYFE